MRKIKRFLKEIFSPEEMNGLDMTSIGEALNEPAVRTIWLLSIADEIKSMNQEVDRRLLTGSDLGLIDLCAKRRAYQDVLEAILSAKRAVTQDVRHNPRPVGKINLDRVTA